MVQNGTWQWLLEGFKFDLEAVVKPKTLEYYLTPIQLFARWAENGAQITAPGLVSKRDLQRFFYDLIQDSGAAHADGSGKRHVRRTERSKWHYYRALRRFFSWAVKEGYLEQNPIAEIRLKPPRYPPIEPYTPEHIEKILSVIEHDWQAAVTHCQKMLAARDKAILLLFLESGLRLAELAVLKVESVDLHRQRALVREGKMGKGRLTGFGIQTKKALWRYLGLRPPEVQTEALWLTEEGRPLTRHGVQMIIRRLKRDAGLQHVKGSVHKLRHTFATAYLRHTRDMKGCRLLLGHSTLAMTERYTQFIEAEDALQAYDGQGPLDWLRDPASQRGPSRPS